MRIEVRYLTVELHIQIKYQKQPISGITGLVRFTTVSNQGIHERAMSGKMFFFSCSIIVEIMKSITKVLNKQRDNRWEILC